MTATEAVEWVEVVVSEIRRNSDEDPRQREHVMILAERGGDRSLPIWIGPAEATVLALVLESVETPRPFPYKLAAGLVEAAGSRITEVKITRLLESVFYACVVVQGQDGPREVDARPSDAVNLAVVTGAPIRLNSELFSVATADDDAEEPSSFPVATADIAAETQQRMREAAQRHGRRSGSQPSGSAAPDDHPAALPSAERCSSAPEAVALVNHAPGLVLRSDKGVRINYLERDPHPEHGLQSFPPNPAEHLALGPREVTRVRPSWNEYRP